jgi:hypothetical protein
VSQCLAQCALEAVGIASGLQSLNLSPLLPSLFHPCVPQALEAPLACCVMSLRQYLTWGDVDQMTLLAKKAFGLFEEVTADHSLLRSVLFVEASQRAWWMIVSPNSRVCFIARIMTNLLVPVLM